MGSLYRVQPRVSSPASTGLVLTHGVGLHGYNGIILEVSESSQVVAITLF